jgi:hypothetical protein
VAWDRTVVGGVIREVLQKMEPLLQSPSGGAGAASVIVDPDEAAVAGLHPGDRVPILQGILPLRRRSPLAAGSLS